MAETRNSRKNCLATLHVATVHVAPARATRL